MQTRMQIEIQIELPSHMRGALIAFQKHVGHTYIHTAAYPWPTVRDPMPRANALGNYTVFDKYNVVKTTFC